MSFSDNRADSIMDCTNQDPPTDSDIVSNCTFPKIIQIIHLSNRFIHFLWSQRICKLGTHRTLDQQEELLSNSREITSPRHHFYHWIATLPDQPAGSSAICFERSYPKWWSQMGKSWYTGRNAIEFLLSWSFNYDLLVFHSVTPTLSYWHNNAINSVMVRTLRLSYAFDPAREKRAMDSLYSKQWLLALVTTSSFNANQAKYINLL